MAEGTEGGFSMSTSDILKWAALLIAIGGGIARYETRQNWIESRLNGIEESIVARDDLLRRAVRIIEKGENDTPLRESQGGVSSGSSSRRGR